MDRTTAAETASVFFDVPPGGRALFPKFQEFAQKTLKIARGDSCIIAPVVAASQRANFERWMSAQDRSADTGGNLLAAMVVKAYLDFGVADMATANGDPRSVRASAEWLPPSPLGPGAEPFFLPESHVRPHPPYPTRRSPLRQTDPVTGDLNPESAPTTLLQPGLGGRIRASPPVRVRSCGLLRALRRLPVPSRCASPA